MPQAARGPPLGRSPGWASSGRTRPSVISDRDSNHPLVSEGSSWIDRLRCGCGRLGDHRFLLETKHAVSQIVLRRPIEEAPTPDLGRRSSQRPAQPVTTVEQFSDPSNLEVLEVDRPRLGVLTGGPTSSASGCWLCRYRLAEHASKLPAVQPREEPELLVPSRRDSMRGNPPLRGLQNRPGCIVAQEKIERRGRTPVARCTGSHGTFARTALQAAHRQCLERRDRGWCLRGRPMAHSHRAAELDHASRIDLDAPTTARRVLNTIRARTFPPDPSATLRDDGPDLHGSRSTIEEVAEDG